MAGDQSKVHYDDTSLFPLNTVLFPGIPVYLHIFEARYKQMIEQCIAEERSFGVVLSAKGSKLVDRPNRMRWAVRLKLFARSDSKKAAPNIVALGQRRFRVAHLSWRSTLSGRRGGDCACMFSHRPNNRLTPSTGSCPDERYVGALRQFRGPAIILTNCRMIR